jgi:hypothetical protein
MTTVSWISRTAGAAETERGAAERDRQAAVRLVFFIYLLFLAEGMLRKWAFPQASAVLYFIRDPFVLALYWIAISRGLVQVQGAFLVWLMVAVATSLFGLLALALNGVGPIGGLLAMRSYWLYMPLAFVIAGCFTREDVFRFVRLNLLLALPISLLVLAQYAASAEAFINRGIDADALVPTVADGMVRPYGVFTYAGQHLVYVASLVALLALGWIERRDQELGLPLLVIASGAVLVMALTTGSRSIWFYGLQLVLVLGLLVVVAGRPGVRSAALAFLLLFTAAAALLWLTALDPAREAMLVRHADAQAIEGAAADRVLGILTSFTDVIADVPLLGYGIGANTSTVRAWTGRFAGAFPAENEWERIAQELGPFFGLALIMVRALFILYLVLRAMRAARDGDATGLLLLGFVGILFLVGQITFSTIMGFLAWFYVGFVLAVTRPAEAVGPMTRSPRWATG